MLCPKRAERIRYATLAFLCLIHLVNVKMTNVQTDPAWEEYLSTGIDPTGGELGPDFDPETGEPLDDEQEDY